ncbi:MAG: aminotransferase class V-fold PLP-dependent enzyme [Nocardioidaceae bacterium]
MTDMLSLPEAQALFHPQPGWLNTANYGLPPDPAWAALQQALSDWRAGATSWEAWDATTGQARACFARLVGATAADVAVGAVSSQFVGLIAASLPDGSHVLAPEIEFGSNLFPYQMHGHRGVTVDTVPADELVDHIDESIDLVSVSVVQSSNGTVTDLEAVSAKARGAGALLAVDATQAVGWLPVDVRLVDAMVCSGYKWLCSPRGTAYCYLSPVLRDRVLPEAAGWYSGENVEASFYGPSLTLAHDARRFDLSPAWHCWVGAASALELIERVGVAAIHRYDVALANRFRAGLDLPPADSAIVCVGAPEAGDRLARAGIRASTRAGQHRLSFHLYNTDADVDAALTALHTR